MMLNKRVADMPNNIPGTVRIGAVTYTIVFDAAEIHAASANTHGGQAGEWSAYSDHEKLIIGINPEHALDANRFSMIHEILHCALRSSGSHPGTYADVVYEAHDRVAGLTVEEFTVSAMTGPLLSALRDNPQLVAYLTADH